MTGQNTERDQIEISVKHCYSTWGPNYYDEYYGAKAPYPPVQTELLRKLLRRSSARTLIDAGCGPASFLRDATDLGIELYGFDLTPEMVIEGQRIFREKGLSPDRIWIGSILDPLSFVAPTDGTSRYDAVVCGGVLPHIPAEEDMTVIRNIASALNPGGLCAMEARNQLFALFTMNRYSYELIVNELIEPEKLKAVPSVDPVKIDAMLLEMQRCFRMDIPPIRKGKAGEPGYDEVLSRSHNPIILKEKFEAAGFVDVKIIFYHYHAFPPMFQGLMPEAFLERSLAMESNPEDWRGYFMASAFYMVGRKTL
jgi:2-polyprenyl-3-methyl-5-hydroxy-6-metoxy-1,4-benzoquinol methylase